MGWIRKVQLFPCQSSFSMGFCVEFLLNAHSRLNPHFIRTSISLFYLKHHDTPIYFLFFIFNESLLSFSRVSERVLCECVTEITTKRYTVLKWRPFKFIKNDMSLTSCYFQNQSLQKKPVTISEF